MKFVGKLVVMDRGEHKNVSGVTGHAVLVCGVLVTENGRPMQVAPRDTEKWHAEVEINIVQRFKSMVRQGDIGDAVLSLNDDGIWEAINATK